MGHMDGLRGMKNLVGSYRGGVLRVTQGDIKAINAGVVGGARHAERKRTHDDSGLPSGKRRKRSGGAGGAGGRSKKKGKKGKARKSKGGRGGKGGKRR